MAQLALQKLSLAAASSIIALEATAQAAVTTQENTPSTDDNTEERTTTASVPNTVTKDPRSQAQAHERLPQPPSSSLLLSQSLPLSFLPEDIPSIKWTAINDVSGPPATDSTSLPNIEERQVPETKRMCCQIMNNMYSTYSRGYRAIRPSPNPPHLGSSSLAAPSQPKKKSTKSSSSPPTSTTVTAIVQPGRNLIQEQTILRRRLRNQVSKVIGNNDLLLANIGGISHEEEGGKCKGYTTDPDTPICPFTQDELDSRYRDAIQTYLQEHYSSSEAISTIIEKSVQHFQWCCAMWEYVPRGNNTIQDPSTPQKEVSRLVKELKQLEKEHRSTLTKAEDTSSDRHSLSILRTPALSVCSSTVSSAINSPALTFSTPPTLVPSFELDGAHAIEDFASMEKCVLSFSDKTNRALHGDAGEDKVKGEEQTKAKAPIKGKKLTKGHTKDKPKATTKAKINGDKEKTKIKVSKNTQKKAKEDSKRGTKNCAKGKAKENTKRKAAETTKGNVKESKSGQAKDPPRGQKMQEPSDKIFKSGGGEILKASRLSTVKTTRSTSEKKTQKEVLTKQGPATDTLQQLATYAKYKDSRNLTPQNQSSMLAKVSLVRDNGRDTQPSKDHLRSSKRPLDDDDSLTSITGQEYQPNRKRKL